MLDHECWINVKKLPHGGAIVAELTVERPVVPVARIAPAVLVPTTACFQWQMLQLLRNGEKPTRQSEQTIEVRKLVECSMGKTWVKFVDQADSFFEVDTQWNWPLRMSVYNKRYLVGVCNSQLHDLLKGPTTQLILKDESGAAAGTIEICQVAKRKHKMPAVRIRPTTPTRTRSTTPSNPRPPASSKGRRRSMPRMRPTSPVESRDEVAGTARGRPTYERAESSVLFRSRTPARSRSLTRARSLTSLRDGAVSPTRGRAPPIENIRSMTPTPDRIQSAEDNNVFIAVDFTTSTQTWHGRPYQKALEKIAQVLFPSTQSYTFWGFGAKIHGKVRPLFQMSTTPTVTGRSGLHHAYKSFWAKNPSLAESSKHFLEPIVDMAERKGGGALVIISDFSSVNKKLIQKLGDMSSQLRIILVGLGPSLRRFDRSTIGKNVVFFDVNSL